MLKFKTFSQTNFKKITTLSASIVAVLIFGAIVFAMLHSSAPPKILGTTKAACELLTAANSRAVLNSTSHKVKGAVQDEKNTSMTTTKNMETTICTYKESRDYKGIQSATLIVRTPYTKTGIESNKKYFNSLDEAKGEKLKLYGYPSYWDYKKGQLEIYKNNTWYSIIVGDSDPSKRDLSQVENLSDVLASKL